MTEYLSPTLSLPETVEELVSSLADARNPAIVAGGTMLMPQLAQRTRRVDTLVALDRMPGATDISTGPDGSTTLGPLTTYTSLLEWAGAPPLLAHISRGITGGPQIRNQGTIVGAACFANPASDMPTGLVAAGATMHLVGGAGPRTISAAEFFLGPFTTQVAADEALVAITLPADAASDQFGYCKIKRSASSWPLATAAALRLPDGSFSIALGAAVERPVLIELNVGREVNATLIDDAVTRTCTEQGVRWWADELAEPKYRRRVAPVAVAEVAAFVSYLAGPDAAYITGSSLNIDGGFTA